MKEKQITQSPTLSAGGPMRCIDCQCYGVPMRLMVGSDELIAAVPRYLPFATEMNSAPVAEAENFTLLPPENHRGYRCYAGAELTGESAEGRPVLEQFARDLMTHVGNFCPDRVFVHAGVVGWKGQALVLPGTSFAGKSTLSAALVRAGATYYSDEFAIVDEMGWVHPYARDLQIREPGSREQRNTPVELLNGHAGTTPLRVAQVVFAHYESGAHWNPQPLSPGMAVLELLLHCIPVQRDPRRAMSTLTAMVAGATAWSSARGEADAVAHALLQSLPPLHAPERWTLRREGALT